MTAVPRLRWFALLLLLGAALSGRAQPAEDQALIAHLQTRSREIQREILQAEDPARTAELQREMMDLMDETLAKVSPPTRVMLELGVKVGRPIMEEGNAYMQRAAGFMAKAFDVEAWTSAEQLAGIRAELTELKAMNDALLESIDHVEEHARSVIDESDFSSKEKAEFLEGFMQPLNRQIGPMRAMRTLESRTYEEMDKLYALLADNSDQWQLDEASGTVEWLNEDIQTRFDEIVAQIQTYSERQQNAAQVMQGRL